MCSFEQTNLVSLNKLSCEICVVGTGVDSDVALQFVAATGAVIGLHDLSVHSLCADYDPFMDIRTYV